MKLKFALPRLVAVFLIGGNVVQSQIIEDIFGDAVEQVEQIRKLVTDQAQQTEKPDNTADNKEAKDQPEARENELTVSEKFEKFAKEIEDEMERRELEGNKNLKIVRTLQEEQRKIFRERHTELKQLAAERRTRETRKAISEQLKKQRLAGARLNELEQKAEMLMASSSDGRNRNNDLMTKLHGFTRNLSAEERTKFHQDGKAQRRHSALLQKVMASRHRSYNQQGYVDLTDSLVEQIEINEVRYPDHPGNQNGALQDARDSLNRLLRLTWQGNQIAVDQGHWDELFAERSPTDLSKDVDLLLKKHGVSMPETDRHGMPFRHGIPQTNVARLFDLLRQEFGNSGRSSSGSSNNITVSFTGSTANAQLVLKGNLFRFEFRERAFPHRLLIIEQAGPQLTMTLYGDVVLRFKQADDGSIRVVETMEDELITRSSDSLGKLYQTDPEFVETRLFPLLYHVGIIPPASRFDSSIVDRVVERLGTALETNDAETAFRLISELDADDYQIRQAATKRLEAKVDQFRELLVAAANDQDASFEKRSRIKFLLDKDSLDSVESDGLISSLRLLDDPQYLAIIMQELGEDDCKPIAHRLEKLTGETFGNDVDAWRSWLAKAEAKQAIGID